MDEQLHSMPPMDGPGGPPGFRPVVLPDLDFDHMTLDWTQYRNQWRRSEDQTHYELRFVYFATHILSREHQYMNIFVPAAYMNPDGTVNASGSCGEYTAKTAPIVIYNNCGGWMSSTPGDVNMDYISEGFVHISVGARSRNAGPVGKAPAACVDQKAAVRMLRLHDSYIPGDKERIISCGGSGGGQMSSIIGATGNMVDYYPYLYEIGAAGVEKNAAGGYVSTIRDDIFASQCYCPIADIEHADMAYAWQRFDDPNIKFSGFGIEGEQTLSTFKLALQNDLAQAWAGYVNRLHLTNEQNEALTFPQRPDGSYDLRNGSYYRQILSNISDALNAYLGDHTQPDGSLSVTIVHGFESREAQTYPSVEAYFATLKDVDKWLVREGGRYRVTDLPGFCQGTALARGKDCPGFDTFHYTAENNAFGTPEEQGVHFSAANGTIMAEHYGEYQDLAGFQDCDVAAYIADSSREDLKRQTYLLNATQILLSAARGEVRSTPAKFWRTRNGTADEHTSFCIAYNLCMAAKVAGSQVDYALIWNAGHGDVDGDGTGTFAQWVHKICK